LLIGTLPEIALSRARADLHARVQRVVDLDLELELEVGELARGREKEFGLPAAVRPTMAPSSTRYVAVPLRCTQPSRVAPSNSSTQPSAAPAAPAITNAAQKKGLTQRITHLHRASEDRMAVRTFPASRREMLATWGAGYRLETSIEVSCR
jgi:hypothetical protein